MERDQASKFVNDLLRLMVIAQRLRPVPHRRLPAGDQGRRQGHQGLAAAADRPAHAGAGALDHERQAGRRVRAHQGVQLRDLAAGHRPLPRQRLRAAGQRRHGAADDPADAADHRQPGPAARAQGRRDDQARPGDPGRRHRLGQDARRWPRWSTTATRTRYGHIITIEDPVEFVHPHKNCIVTQREVGIDTDGWEHRAEEHAAPGARRDPDGRDPRPRDDGARASPSPRPATCAWPRCTPTAPTRRSTAIINFFPEERRAAAADGPVAQPAGAGLAAPAAAPGGQGPRRGGRDHAEHAADLRPDLQGRGRPRSRRS